MYWEQIYQFARFLLPPFYILSEQIISHHKEKKKKDLLLIIIKRTWKTFFENIWKRFQRATIFNEKLNIHVNKLIQFRVYSNVLHCLTLLALSCYITETKITHCVNDSIVTVSLDEFYIYITSLSFVDSVTIYSLFVKSHYRFVIGIDRMNLLS